MSHRTAALTLPLVMLLALLAAVPAAAASPTRTTVTVRATATAPYAGSASALSGTISPARAGRTVQLQVLSGRRWVPVTQARTTARGGYRVSVPTRRLGARTYRVRVLAGAGADARTSPVVRVTVRSRPAGSTRSYKILLPGFHRADYSRWNPCQSITYRVNPGPFGAGAVRDARAAVARVAAASGLRFTYRGTSGAVPESRSRFPRDAQLLIAWARPGVSTMLPRGTRSVGVATQLDFREMFTAKGESVFAITQAGVVLNANAYYPGGFGSGSSRGLYGTRGQLLMHELGHAVGLGHVKQSSQVMYPVITRKQARWGAGDLAGLRAVGKPMGCLSPTRPAR